MTLFKSKQNDTADTSAGVDFLLRERISAQWSVFLLALSAEMQNQLAAEEYRELLRSIGLRMAELLPIGPRETVEELEAAINQRLKDMQWGYASLVDSGSLLHIHHHFSPLECALGVNAEVAGGLLEGVYEYWFRAAGADEGLSVKQVPGSLAPTVLEYQFGRN